MPNDPEIAYKMLFISGYLTGYLNAKKSHLNAVDPLLLQKKATAYYEDIYHPEKRAKPGEVEQKPKKKKVYIREYGSKIAKTFEI